jgi:multidrug efflux pump subunit AcrB
VGQLAIEHRWKVFAGSLLFLLLGGYLGYQLKTQFFPDDAQYLSFLDIWLPNDAPLFVTNQTAMRVEQAVRATTEKYGREHPGKDGQPRHMLKSLTTFVGGGAPRFWFSVTPQLQQPNYSQMLPARDSRGDRFGNHYASRKSAVWAWQHSSRSCWYRCCTPSSCSI